MFVALAPIANMKNSTILKPVVDFITPLWSLLNHAHVWEVFNDKIKQDFVNLAESPYLSWTDIINKIVNTVAGAKYTDPTTEKIALNKFPNQTSIKSLIHLG